MRPRTRYAFAIAFAPLCAAVAAACNLGGKCGDPQRGVWDTWVEGPLPPTAQSILASVSLGQIKNRPITGWWEIRADRLRSHVTRIELREGGELFASLPLEPAGPYADAPISKGYNLPALIRIPIEDAWASLAAGRVAVEFQTDLPDRPLIRLASPSSHGATGYERAYCS
jgi:hypothetical protein